jgi:hypothetical protein
VTPGQPLDPKAELSQPSLREINLPVLEGIFIAAPDQKRELVALGLEQAAEVETIALRLVVGYEAGPLPCRTGRHGG